jgi:hypothetical protein
MIPARRQMLTGAIAVALGPLAGRLALAETPAPDTRALLAAYVDVLLPEDDVTPPASALGVHDAILDLASGQELLARLIALVADWLDQTGPAPFASLPLPEQEARVATLAAADPDQLEGRFHQLIRLLAIEVYYARPEALAGLDIAAAPQPAGYPPPWV